MECMSLLVCTRNSHYMGIALNGYQYDENVAFFPLLPWLIRLVMFCIGC